MERREESKSKVSSKVFYVYVKKNYASGKKERDCYVSKLKKKRKKG